MSELRASLCFEIAKQLIEPPTETTAHAGAYVAWRDESLQRSWGQFDDADIRGKEVLDFGCGSGSLSFFLASRQPQRIVGVDLMADLIALAQERAGARPEQERKALSFLVGDREGIPVDAASFDTLCAFDCVEHIMEPSKIFAEWARVLRPGGKVLIEWFPFRGPWGPHMESLVPIPWAHFLFGERALFSACERMYEHPGYQHRAWDYTDEGELRPNKWKQWRTFEEQSYVNELRVDDFVGQVETAGFAVTRLQRRTFGKLPARRALEPLVTRVPVLGELMTSWIVVELTRS